MSGLVEKKWIRTDLDEDFVERDGVNAEPLSEQVVELFIILVGFEDEGERGRWFSAAELSITVIVIGIDC